MNGILRLRKSKNEAKEGNNTENLIQWYFDNDECPKIWTLCLEIPPTKGQVYLPK